MTENAFPVAFIREGRLADLDELLALETQAFRCDCLSRQQFRYHLRRASDRLFVADAAGRVAGYIILLRRSELGRIYSLAVGQAFRGHGVGRALCLHAEDVARTLGLQRIRLEVRSRNRPARALYQSLGYREIARLPAYYADGADGVRLEKRFNGLSR